MKTKTRRLLSLLNFCVLTLLACGNSDGAEKIQESLI